MIAENIIKFEKKNYYKKGKKMNVKEAKVKKRDFLFCFLWL